MSSITTAIAGAFPTSIASRRRVSLLCTRSSASLSPRMDHTSPGLYPLHHCKTIHLVRHAQGIHNVEGDKNYKAYMLPDYFDAELTQLGWQQVDNLRKHVHSSGLSKRIELVITSPLMRTMQTAVGVFGGEGYTDGMRSLPLMVANVGNSNHSAISSLNCPPVLAVELCREILGVQPCDKRRNISEYRCLFPKIDFSLIESDEDILWKADVREKKEELEARGMKFLHWLWTRKEREIAVVTHSAFLFHTLSQFGNEFHPSMKYEICKSFRNCELRSMVIADRSMIGSDPPTTNYPGKIPSGPDVPSEAAVEKGTRESMANMEFQTSPSLYLLHHCKTIHLVRHAQGIHNVEGDKNYKAYMSPEYFDAELTPLGWQQVDNLRKHVHSSGLSKRIELVITSPLMRTMQTAVGVFGGEGYTADGMHILPLMVANAGNNDHSAISSLNRPPIVAVELCREHLGVHPCDKRRNISEYRRLFPAVNFSLVESDEDILWKADVREKKKELAARGMNFFNWLLTLKEREIAVVSHNAFLFHTLSQFGDECHPSMEDEIRKSFRNCELRSVVIANRSEAADDKGTGESIEGASSGTGRDER